MKRALGLACVVALLVAAAATAKPRLIASGVDEGAGPMASAFGTVEDPTRGPRIEARAWPSDLLHVEVDVHCYRDSHNRGYDRDLPVAPSPTSQRLNLPLRNPDSCSISAYARYEDEMEGEGELARLREGRISLKIFR